ncbi:hypothetical protein ACE1ET_04845 [Saccharicrinis sp. FJH62]|uniref:hypothetical protein n=1 Tax=Saccharicrinis sp. FJH62 TaxID=3344657 RepID=UPI0035D4D76E
MKKYLFLCIVLILPVILIGQENESKYTSRAVVQDYGSFLSTTERDSLTNDIYNVYQ